MGGIGAIPFCLILVTDDGKVLGGNLVKHFTQDVHDARLRRLMVYHSQQIRRPATGMIQVTHAGPLDGSHHANASQTSYCRSERAGEIVEIASKWSAVSPQAMLPLSENPRLSWSNGTALHCCLASSLKPAVCSTYLSCIAPCDCRLGPIRTRTLHCHIASPRTEHAPRAGILYPSILFQSKVFPTP